MQEEKCDPFRLSLSQPPPPPPTRAIPQSPHVSFLYCFNAFTSTLSSRSAIGSCACAKEHR